MPWVNCPPGMAGVTTFDGRNIKATREGGRMFVDDHHAKAINGMSGNGDAGLLNASNRTVLGTKRGRACEPCHRVWNVWSVICPRCGGDTEPE